MGATFPTPAPSLLDKLASGYSDMTISEGVYKFLGCSVISINISVGFNGTATSATVNLVEDTQKGDSFIVPVIPSLLAVSLPKGGIGQPTIYTEGYDLNPNGFFPTNTPFYFCGICTTFSEGRRDTGGRTISVTIADPREILSGVQCLLGGFALSQNLGAVNRYENVNNVIDVFGYYDKGMESNKNEYGMQWFMIKNVIENVRITLHDISLEFLFTGTAFTNAPDWYRLDDQVADLLGLVQKVANDSGSDLIVFARKQSAIEATVELRAVTRNNTDPLTIDEVENFISDRTDIVETARIGREYKNEPTSSIIVGGFRNSNYVALPSSFDQSMHMTGPYEDYNKFPADIKVRLLGGSAAITVDTNDGSPLSTTVKSYDITSGAIYPFWGFTPDDHAYPLLEPFLSLDHLVFDRISDATAHARMRIPLCAIDVGFFTVRNVPHSTVFLSGDEIPDDRPFAYLSGYYVGQEDNFPGYVRGLPLNTEVLRAALMSEEAFYSIYSLYYPDIAVYLGYRGPNWAGMRQNNPNSSLMSVRIADYLYSENVTSLVTPGFTRDQFGRIQKSIWNSMDQVVKEDIVLTELRAVIYQQVKQYASENMGKKFLVCLPSSTIMNRIWLNLPVPTRPLKPEIEYIVDQRGYWENVPVEFDGIQTDDGTFTGSEEEQIRRKFMAEDGRFVAMVAIDWLPTGNASFNSNGYNKAMFQDFPSSEFRPNKIAEGNPRYVFVSCSANQLVKRPDLALVEIPGPIMFDPTFGNGVFNAYDAVNELQDDEFIATKHGLMRFFWYFAKKDNNLRAMIVNTANKIGANFGRAANAIFATWAEQLYSSVNLPFTRDMSTEVVMDLKGAIIPLTSTWVSYGPWYATYDQAQGMVNLQVDESLVPWNFTRPTDDPWYTNLDIAGFDRLNRSLSVVDYLDVATIVVAGLPEFGPAYALGYNSNVTGINTELGIGGIKTTYNLSTFAGRPGTYRKSEYDNVSRARFDAREQLPTTINENLVFKTGSPDAVNRFQ